MADRGAGATVDRWHDVVALGSGAAGLVAAIATADEGAEVGLYEKSDLLGGTSAMSGGIIWMPNNHLQAEAGIDDSRAGGLAYLDSLSLGQIVSDMAATFVDTGPEMLSYLSERTPCSCHLLETFGFIAGRSAAGDRRSGTMVSNSGNRDGADGGTDG